MVHQFGLVLTLSIVGCVRLGSCFFRVVYRLWQETRTQVVSLARNSLLFQPMSLGCVAPCNITYLSGAGVSTILLCTILISKKKFNIMICSSHVYLKNIVVFKEPQHHRETIIIHKDLRYIIFVQAQLCRVQTAYTLH